MNLKFSAVDASPLPTPIEKSHRAPHLSEISNQAFGKHIDSRDSPSTPPVLMDCKLPISVKKRPAPPPPPAQSKPTLKSISTESEDQESIQASEDSTDLDRETKELLKQLISLRMKREQLELELKQAEDKLATKVSTKCGNGFEPFVQVSVVEDPVDPTEPLRGEHSQHSISSNEDKSLEDEVIEALDSVLEEAENDPTDYVTISPVPDMEYVNYNPLLSPYLETSDKVGKPRPVPPPRRGRKHHEEPDTTIVRL